MLFVHDALEAWKLGKITPKQAMKLAGACSVEELHELAVACDVNTGATDVRLRQSDSDSTFKLRDGSSPLSARGRNMGSQPQKRNPRRSEDFRCPNRLAYRCAQTGLQEYNSSKLRRDQRAQAVRLEITKRDFKTATSNVARDRAVMKSAAADRLSRHRRVWSRLPRIARTCLWLWGLWSMALPSWFRDPSGQVLAGSTVTRSSVLRLTTVRLRESATIPPLEEVFGPPLYTDER